MKIIILEKNSEILFLMKFFIVHQFELFLLTITNNNRIFLVNIKSEYNEIKKFTFVCLLNL